jgi:hypothetical protein
MLGGGHLDNICECIVPSLCCGQFIRFEGVGIQFQSDGWIRVTEPLRNSWDRNALTEQLTCVSMPKRVQANSTQARFQHDFRDF